MAYYFNLFLVVFVGITFVISTAWGIYRTIKLHRSAKKENGK